MAREVYGKATEGPEGRWPKWSLFVACMLVVLLPPPSGSVSQGWQTGFRVSTLWSTGSDVGFWQHVSYLFSHTIDWVIGWRWTLGLLVSVPFWLVQMVEWKLERISEETESKFVLDIGPTPAPSRGSQPSEAQRDRDEWSRIKHVTETTWEYERDRFLEALRRHRLNANLFCNLATVALTSSVIVLTLRGGDQDWGKGLEPATVQRLMVSVAAATSTVFLIKLAHIMVRISSLDISSRMFAWAARSLALVVVADVGLFILFEGEVATAARALLLGVFTGATGDHAIQLLLDKAAALFKTASARASGPSPLLAIEGMTPEHVDRLEEEDIVSVHDLAFVPTARLFFRTAYSLQQICDWQDRALLSVYVGPEGAKSLNQHMKIIGAIDLRACAHEILYEGGDHEALRDKLRTSVALEAGGIDGFLDSMAHDEVTMRIRLYWQSAVTNQPSSAKAPGTDRTRARESGEIVVALVEDRSRPVAGAR